MIRSTTDEMLAARFDPEPYIYESDEGTQRLDAEEALANDLGYLDPRPEFIPSRDPEPFIAALGTRTSMALEGDKFWRWSPRPEYARPEPNPILVDFRNSVNGDAASLARNWLWLMEDDPDMDDHFVWAPIRNPRPAEIEDARKVLTRLVGVFG